MCRGCAHERTCIGGCRESAFATFGDTTHVDPLVQMALDPEWRERMAQDVPQAVVPLRRLTESRS
jgi:hypothetical protein